MILVAVVLCGCSREPVVYDVQFEPNLVHAMKYQMKEEIPMDQALADAFWVVEKEFGTPDEPSLPALFEEDDYQGLISLEKLKRAAGPVAEGSGLYRKHCASCHGDTGNGRGVNAAVSNPYPRDYRLGIFKFKSTRRGAKPTRDDIARTIRHGIPGTTMVKIPELTDDDIDALTDYVIYLSLRGQLERMLIDDAVFELDLEVDRIVEREFGQLLQDEGRGSVETFIDEWQGAGGPEGERADKMVEQLELYDESMEYASELLAEIADAWFEAEDDVVEVPEPPAEIPVSTSKAHYVELSQGDQAEALAKSVARGKEVFTGKVASCGKCHGEKGLGDGQTNDYDDWTKDWTLRIGLKPEDTDSLIPLMARGALPPRNALPRNFTEGIFRGGETPEDLYRRISQGIEGSPMPKATHVAGDYEKDDIWHLINFVRSLDETETDSK
ncbi:MAG: cytochrome c [Planctomycetota bacterium]